MMLKYLVCCVTLARAEEIVSIYHMISLNLHLAVNCTVLVCPRDVCLKHINFLADPIVPRPYIVYFKFGHKKLIGHVKICSSLHVIVLQQLVLTALITCIFMVRLFSRYFLKKTEIYTT